MKTSITKKEILEKIELAEDILDDVRFTDTHRISTVLIGLRNLRDILRADLNPLKKWS